MGPAPVSVGRLVTLEGEVVDPDDPAETPHEFLALRAAERALGHLHDLWRRPVLGSLRAQVKSSTVHSSSCRRPVDARPMGESDLVDVRLSA